MPSMPTNPKLRRLTVRLSKLCRREADRELLARSLQALDRRYDLAGKLSRERGVAEVVEQMVGRMLAAFGDLSHVRAQRILDIACGSRSSRAPSSVYIDTPFGAKRIRASRAGYAAQFEPWFCRLALELGAEPVGVDFGNLDGETFEHYRVDLGQPGALDFLPAHTFDAVQDSRLFGSPEFTAQFPNEADRLAIAREIRRQEQRVLKPGGIVVHSDAAALLHE